MKNMISSIAKLGVAAWLGAVAGGIVSILAVACFGLVILNPILNIYWAFILFIVGAVFSYKLSKKNQIML